jgi:hypothetical protein
MDCALLQCCKSEVKHIICDAFRGTVGILMGVKRHVFGLVRMWTRNFLKREVAVPPDGGV